MSCGMLYHLLHSQSESPVVVDREEVALKRKELLLLLLSRLRLDSPLLVVYLFRFRVGFAAR